MGATSSWTLHGWGSVPWETVRRLVGDRTAAWADYGGFQIGPCPDSAPPYSHLWAWSEGADILIRVRIDGAQGIVGALASVDLPGDMNDPLQSHAVETMAYDGIPWGDDGQIGDAVSALLDKVGRIRIQETLEPNPAMFVHVQLK